MSRPIHRTRSAPIALPLAILLGIISVAVAQYQLGSHGHALDASIQLNSGGYNYGVPQQSSMAARRYFPGASKPIYTISSSGGLEYNQHNAFNPHAGYTSTGYRGYHFTPTSPVPYSPYRYR